MTILYTNDVVGETSGGINIDNYNDSICTTSIESNWWGTDPAFEYLMANTAVEDNAGGYINVPAHWSGSSATTINYRALIEFGPDFFTGFEPESRLMKFLWMGNSGSGANPVAFIRRVVDTENRLGNGSSYVYNVFTACESNGGVEHDEFGEEYPQDSYTSGNTHTLRLNERIGEIICVEWEASAPGTNNLYVGTQDGDFVDTDVYATITSAALSGDLPWSSIAQAAYKEATIAATSDTWVRVGQIVIADAKIGAPAGFYAGADPVLAITANLSLTEYQASVTAGYSVEATTDALTLTEHAASVVSATTVNATTHAMSLTTIAASINSSATVNASVSNLVMTTYSAVVSYPVLTTTDVLTLTSYQASVSQVTSSTTKGSYDKTNIIKKEPFGIRA